MKTLPAVRIEGGLFASDLVDQLLAEELPRQKARDFGLDGRRSLTDEIAAVFSDAQALWRVFQHRLERLPESDLGTTVTREAWVIPFLGLLGYELRYNQRAYVFGGLTFAVSHRAGEPEDAPPVHIVGVRRELGRRGRERLAPHSLVQEFLNRTEALWGLVTNGKILRLLRDSTYIRRQVYVEFDLQAIFEQRLFEDFAVLYRLLHRTRLPQAGADAHRCLLEQYYQRSVDQGGRVREHLRDGVEECVKRLANGFLRHPENQELREQIGRMANSEWRMNVGAGATSAIGRSPFAHDFYRQLLRLVYRFLFLFVSEDRGLISRNSLYLEHYSVSRLRRLVDNRAAYTEDDDLWHSLRALWKLLSDDKPVQQIGGRPLAALLDLPVLNGELFEPLLLDNCRITNRDLLEALWRLVNYQENPSSPPRRVNYAALDVEELGSVYESLLDYHPVIEANGGWRMANGWKFDLVYGSERKSTGSYYTPPQLVAELVRSALEPVMEERLASSERRAASSDGSDLIEEEKRYVYQVLSRPSGLAERHGVGQTRLSTDAGIPEGGNVRADVADSASGSVGPREHRGGLGKTDDRRIPAVPPQCPGQPARAGDPPAPGNASQTGNQRSGSTPLADMSGHRTTIDQSPAQPYSEEAFLRLWRSLPLAARRSLLAERALLSVRVCDPACGSGHFLLAAARRLGKELARIRTGEEEPAPERVREAIRDVVAHCIYGVDKNPLAVELCRVALWIEAHTPGKPLTFLDHRIRCGDSLVGAFDLEALQQGIPDEAFNAVSGDDKKLAAGLKRRNREERRGQRTMFAAFDATSEVHNLSAEARTLDGIADDSPEAIRRKKQHFIALQRKAERDRTACNLWTAAFFQPKNNATPQAALITTDTLRSYLESGAAHPQALAQAQALAQRQRFFHWPLEFPEVFEKRAVSGEQRAVSSEQRAENLPLTAGRSPLADSAARQSPPAKSAAGSSPLADSAGFDVVLGNPPFLGGLKISGTLGDRYRYWLKVAYQPYGGTADLCAAFYRRAFHLLRPGGRMGMVATNTIGQGDTRESGLAVIVKKGGAITFACRFVKWPGAANVEVNLIAIHKPDHSPFAIRHSPTLDGQPVDFISSRLDDELEAEPKRLKQNERKAFQGDIVRGIGFVLEPEEAEALLAKDPRNADCLFPYLNGEDLNSHPEQKPSRWVICFHDWDLERARQYPDLLRIVEERVKPKRERLRGPGDARNRQFWWQFGAYRAGMRRAIAPLRRVLVRSEVSQLHMVSFVPKDWIYSHMLIVFAFDDDYHFALLQSSVHEVWVWRQASSLESRNRYTPTDCFDTFPFPPEEKLSQAAPPLPATIQPTQPRFDYLDDAAVLCLLLDELRKRNRAADEFTLQKHAFVAKEKLHIPLRSGFERKAAGPWSHELRYKAIHAGERRNWLRWQGSQLVQAHSFSRGLERAQAIIGDKAHLLGELVQDLEPFGRSGLERWTTILKIVSDLRTQGKTVTLDAIQAEVDAWPEKRLKKMFTEESVEYTVRQMAKHGWIRLEEAKLEVSVQEKAAQLGAEYHEHRRQIMLARNLGLTQTYNIFHDPNCTDADIQRLRKLHAAMDRAILACYGWDDLDPQHGFYQNERAQTRFTVSPTARRELLRRLLELNLQIADA